MLQSALKVLEMVEEDTSVYTAAAQKAFIIKISGTIEKMLAENQVMIGYSKAEGLLDPNLTKKEFREIIKKQYYSNDGNVRAAGQIAGDLWRFIREIKLGNYIVVPAEEGLYISKVIGPATYDEMRIFNDTAYRRKVEWLNNKKLVPMDLVTDELKKRLKSLQRVIDASDLYIEIEFALRHAG